MLKAWKWIDLHLKRPRMPLHLLLLYELRTESAVVKTLYMTTTVGLSSRSMRKATELRTVKYGDAGSKRKNIDLNKMTVRTINWTRNIQMTKAWEKKQERVRQHMNKQRCEMSSRVVQCKRLERTSVCQKKNSKYGCQGNCALISICVVTKRAEETTANILSLLTSGKSAALYVTSEKHAYFQ